MTTKISSLPLAPGLTSTSASMVTTYKRKLFYHRHHKHRCDRAKFQTMDEDTAGDDRHNCSKITEMTNFSLHETDDRHLSSLLNSSSQTGNRSMANSFFPFSSHHHHHHHRHNCFAKLQSLMQPYICFYFLLLILSLFNTQIVYGAVVTTTATTSNDTDLSVGQSAQPNATIITNNNQSAVNQHYANEFVNWQQSPLPQINQRNRFCGDPPLVPNAQSNLHRNQKHYVFPVGTEATYLCEQGYKAVGGNAKTRCTIDGMDYHGVRHILFPDHGSRSGSGEPVLQKSNRAKNSKRLSDLDEEPELNASGHRSVTFPSDFTNDHDKRKLGRKSDADDLYDYEGHPGAVKQVARWYPPITLNCQLVNCPDPGQVAHSTRHDPRTGTLSFNKNVYYMCDDGYEPVGVPFLICRADGTWNRQPPTCRLKTCPELPELANGKIIYSDPERRTNSRAEYHCNHGFRLNAATHIRLCSSDDRWSSLEPLLYGSYNKTNVTDSSYQCLPVTCPAPVRAHNGVRIVEVNRKQRANKTQYGLGDIIIYNCLSNRLKTTAKCREDGEWSQQAPHCPQNELSRLKCAPISSFWHGMVKINDNQAHFSCNDGYELDGQATIKCNQNGVWGGRLPRCVIPMTLPQVHSTTAMDTNQTSVLAEKESLETQEHSMSETLVILLILISVVIFILIGVGAVALYKWRQRKLSSKTWQRYFGHYYHRQSKTNIVTSTTFVLNGGGSGSGSGAGGSAVTALTTTTIGTGAVSQRLLRNGGGGCRSHHPKSGYLQSSFSSADETTADIKSSYTNGTISSERARTVSTYADDTCPEDDEYDEEDEDENVSIYKSTTLPMTATVAAAATKQHYSVPLDVLTSDIIVPSMPSSSPPKNAEKAAANQRSLSSDIIGEHTYSNVPGFTRPLSSTSNTTIGHGRRIVATGNAQTLINGVPVTDL